MYRCCVYQAVWCVQWKFQVKCSIVCNIKFKFFLHIFIAHTLTSPGVAGFDDSIKWTYLYKITSEHQIHVKTSQKMNIQTKNFLARIGICPCCLWWSIPDVTKRLDFHLPTLVGAFYFKCSSKKCLCWLLYSKTFVLSKRF